MLLTQNLTGILSYQPWMNDSHVELDSVRIQNTKNQNKYCEVSFHDAQIILPAHHFRRSG